MNQQSATELGAAGSNGAMPILPSSAATSDELAHLLGGSRSDEPKAEEKRPDAEELVRANELVQVRMGIASSLFASLRWKHEPTAKHCLRVALTLSGWAEFANLPAVDRDHLELAGLLHDLGKLGVPDQILSKPAALTERETKIMDGHWLMCADILRNCCAAPEVLDIIANASAWYDGSAGSPSRRGEDLPLGSRMLAIADAYDSMTTDQVYRRAFPRERALNEIMRLAGRQFDRRLAEQFYKLHAEGDGERRSAVERRWLFALEPDATEGPWRLNPESALTIAAEDGALFARRLLSNMHDGVAFLDAGLRITYWSPGAERITGLSAESVHKRLWLPSLVQMRDDRGIAIADEQCPVAFAFRTSDQWSRRVLLRGRDGNRVSVDAQAIPVVGNDGKPHGVTLVLHDASPEMSLERRCQTLYDQATKDPLTQLTNRAEFDRLFRQFVDEHHKSDRPCSLIICDIDRFKNINDRCGHQAGDEVIQNFAAMLKSACRTGDVVARYGGEEFVMLCADCDMVTVARRAEKMRQLFAEMVQPAAVGMAVTASFGVTEIQPGDTPDTMLSRADRALLTAKRTGRNRVVEMGCGSSIVQDLRRLTWWGRKPLTGDTLVEDELISEVPLPIAVEKLRGFIADHHAEIVSIDGSTVSMVLNVAPGAFPGLQSTISRSTGFELTAELNEEHRQRSQDQLPGLDYVRTRVRLVITPRRGRDRRRRATSDCARQIAISFRAYLMAHPAPVEDTEGILTRARQFLAPWSYRS